MSHSFDTNSRRTVHWHDQTNDSLPLDSTHGTGSGRHVLLNASLPFYSRLNIRIRTRRDDDSEHDHVTATAQVEHLRPSRPMNQELYLYVRDGDIFARC